CLPNARIGSTKIGPVDWAWTCHNFSGYHERTDGFDFVTLIGNNPLTGETCFFSHSFGPEERRGANGRDIVPPGGWPATSVSERKRASEFWASADDFSCIRCHNANHAWMVTPHTWQSRVGGDGTMDVLPDVTKAGRLHPGKAFRVIGTAHNAGIPADKRPKA